MLADVFGNYIAGYYAGYSGASGAYSGIRAGGMMWAILGRDEPWHDVDSIPAIDAGFAAGRRDLNAMQKK